MEFDYMRALKNYRAIANAHNLNPETLTGILRLTIRGYNRSDTAEDLGITRQTVQRYLKVVRGRLDEAEMQAVLTGLTVAMGGAYYLNDLCPEKKTGKWNDVAEFRRKEGAFQWSRRLLRSRT